MLVLLDLVGVSSSGRLCQQITMGDSFWEIVGSNGIRPCVPMFISGRLVSGGSDAKLSYLFHHGTRIFGSMVKSEAENGTEDEL
jgi:hypothetical protein